MTTQARLARLEKLISRMHPADPIELAPEQKEAYRHSMACLAEALAEISGQPITAETDAALKELFA